MTIEYHPEVERELAEVRDYYEKKLPGLGQQFIDEFEQQVLRIAANQYNIGLKACDHETAT